MLSFQVAGNLQPTFDNPYPSPGTHCVISIRIFAVHNQTGLPFYVFPVLFISDCLGDPPWQSIWHKRLTYVSGQNHSYTDLVYEKDGSASKNPFLQSSSHMTFSIYLVPMPPYTHHKS